MTDERLVWSASECRRDWAAAQNQLAAHAARYGYEHSAEIRSRMDVAGISPDRIRSVADLATIPTLAKDDLPALQASDPPFGGMLAVPATELRRIYRSPGGITDPEGREEDFWRVAPALWAAGFRPGQIALNTLSYHLTPGGHMLDSGLRAVGCVVIPGGVGNSAEQLEIARHSGATGYAGTPQFLETLVERAGDQPVPFERALVTGGPLFPPVRQRLEEAGIDVYQAYGTADAGVLGYDCEERGGWHVSPRAVIEIVRPGTGDPAEDGEPGEVVVSNANLAYPLLRFGTGDLSALDRSPCACGRTSPRLSGFLGRVGEGVKVRGMFVHPRQIAAPLATDPAVARFRGIVTNDGRDDVLTVSVEPAGGAEPDVPAIEAALRDSAKVRVTVIVVDTGTIPADAPPLSDERTHG